MKIIYHILNDEKFTDWVINSFEEVYPNQNKFLLISNNNSSKYFNDSRVEFITKDFFINHLIPSIDDTYIFYYLHLYNITFLCKWRNLEFKKIWVGYGSDYYYYLLRPPYFPLLYKPITKKVFFKPKGINLLKFKLLGIYQYLFYHLKVKEAISSLDYFCPIVSNEFNIIQSIYSFPKLKYLNFTFGDIQYLSIDNGSSSPSDKILINNSATHAGNHLDVFQILKYCNNKQKLLIPLNYGNFQYKEFLIDYCSKNFKDQCELLTEFIPKHEYSKKLNSCGFALMGHVRQQAMGTIYTILFQGTKLFLYKENPVYSYLKKLNFIVFSMDQLRNNPGLLLSLLSSDQKAHNQRILLQHYSKKSSLNRILRICQL